MEQIILSQDSVTEVSFAINVPPPRMSVPHIDLSEIENNDFARENSKIMRMNIDCENPEYSHISNGNSRIN